MSGHDDPENVGAAIAGTLLILVVLCTFAGLITLLVLR